MRDYGSIQALRYHYREIMEDDRVDPETVPHPRDVWEQVLVPRFRRNRPPSKEERDRSNRDRQAKWRLSHQKSSAKPRKVVKKWAGQYANEVYRVALANQSRLEKALEHIKGERTTRSECPLISHRRLYKDNGTRLDEARFFPYFAKREFSPSPDFPADIDAAHRIKDAIITSLSSEERKQLQKSLTYWQQLEVADRRKLWRDIQGRRGGGFVFLDEVTTIEELQGLPIPSSDSFIQLKQAEEDETDEEKGAEQATEQAPDATSPPPLGGYE